MTDVAPPTSPNPPPLEISVSEVARWRGEGRSMLLIDVREPHEHEHCRIDGAKLLPMSQFNEWIGEFHLHRNDPIVVHCHHGGRSLRVTEALRAAGFTHVQNMSGGIDDWSCEIDPTVPRY